MRHGTNPAERAVAGGEERRGPNKVGAPRASDEPLRQALGGQEVSSEAFGIPEEEFTPSVRQALVTLLQRTEVLRREAESANARLTEAAKYADFDALLPILNRRAFVRELTRFIGFTERYGTPSCLVYFDVDKLKAVNDFYGHAAGDFVLGHFANLLQGQIRDTDILARLGGDEFGVILAYSTFEQAVKKGERLMRIIREMPTIWKGQEVHMRFSYGIYKLRAGDSADDAIAKADEAMYSHKHSAARR